MRCLARTLRQTSRHPGFYKRWYSEAENVNVAHSRFLAESHPGQPWQSSRAGRGGEQSLAEEIDDIPEGKGKLSPTSSHLFKLILPLGRFQHSNNESPTPPPTVFLLHPSQPLSHVNRLIASSFVPFPSTAPPPTVSFRGSSWNGTKFQWSDSTDIAHFIKDAARTSQFSVAITPAAPHSSEAKDSKRNSSSDAKAVENHHEDDSQPSGRSSEYGSEISIPVLVPSLSERTRFLRHRLGWISSQLSSMDELKRKCDLEAHRGARRMALGGFGILVVYWAAVARLTFWDYGWDIMEPITYLSGLSTVICGYLWFLYQGREVSYSSLLDRTITSRRHNLYQSEGLDIDSWAELVQEKKRLKREIARIEADYGEQDEAEDGKSKENDEQEHEADGEEKDEKRGEDITEKRGDEPKRTHN